MPKTAGRLEFDKIRFGYQPDNPILHDVSLTLYPGQTVALVGTTGSGKTTLVNLLLRFYDPQQGSIRIDNTDIATMDLQELRTIVGVILQDVFILQDTLFANIVMDTGCIKSRKFKQILDQTGMNRFVDKLPQGLDTLIGEGGTELSTGEKQLLSFARVLCRNPAILVLDEATAAIDTESENILEQAIADSFKGRTSLVIAHRLSTIRRADHIVVMAHGKIVEQGSHEELLKHNGHYALLWPWICKMIRCLYRIRYLVIFARTQNSRRVLMTLHVVITKQISDFYDAIMKHPDRLSALPHCPEDWPRYR